MQISKANYQYKYNNIRFKSDLDTAQKRTFINALNTVDSELYKQEKLSDGIFRNVENLTAFSIILYVLLKKDSVLENIHKKKVIDYLPKLAGITAVSAIVLSAFDYIRAKSRSKSDILGYKISEENMQDPKLFLPFTDEKVEALKQTDLFRYLNSKKFSVTLQDIFADYDLSNQLKFLKNSIKDDNEKSEKDAENNDYKNAMREINAKAQNYTGKTLLGLNLLLMFSCAAVGGVSSIFAEFARHSNKHSKYFNTISATTALLPILASGAFASKNVTENVELVSMYRAKNDYLNSKNNDNNAISLGIEYIKYGTAYRNEIRKQALHTKLNNYFLLAQEAANEELNKASKTKDEFFKALKSRDNKKLNEQSKLNNSFLKDFIFNATLPLTMFFTIRGINELFEKSSNKKMLMLPALCITGVVAGLNSLFGILSGRNQKISKL